MVAAYSKLRYNHQVFLSFKGGDTRKTFTDHLCAALVQAGMSPFIYDDEIKTENSLVFELNTAIQESMIWIIVLSKNYASSTWCLNELVAILDWSKIVASGGLVLPSSTWRLIELVAEWSKIGASRVVLPVFYDVDPSQVRHQTGRIGEAFTLYEEKFIDNETDLQIRKEWTEKLKDWRAALTEVANMTGIVLRNAADSDEPRIIRSVVGFIQDELKTNKISSWGNKVCRLKDSGLSKLPNDMMFPKLEKLFLQDNKYLLAIPLSFFEFMPSLQVLNMSRTSIKKLPTSISNLVKLRKLFLRDCKLLMELPPEIQDLKNLEVFDLSGTELIYIPMEIKKLLKLECLRMSLCASADEYISEINESIGINKRIEIIPENTLSKLSNLKELSIFVDLNCKWWGAIVESIILDLVSLEKLRILKLYFPTVHPLLRLLERQKFCQSLSNFRLVVGCEDQRVISRFFSQELQDEFETLGKCLKYVNGTEDINEVVKMCKYARTLFLDRHWSIERLSVLMNSCENLRFCVLVECNKMKNVIDGHDLFSEGDKGTIGKPVIGSLQYLSIHYMKNLTSIWVGPFPSGSLNNLQILALSTCPNLNTIFDVELLCNLLSLKELIVEDCPKVKSLVSVESSYLEYGKEFLPCLEKITLLFLPELVSISRGLQIAPRLVRMVVYDCPKLQTLSPMEVYSKHIKEIRGESEWWQALKRNSDQLGVFVPLGGDGLMNELAQARTSRNTLSTIQISDENRELNREIESLEGKIDESLKVELEQKEPDKELEVKRSHELVIAKTFAATARDGAYQIGNLVRNIKVVTKAKNIQVPSKNLIEKTGDAGFIDSIPRQLDTVIGFELPLQSLKSILLEEGRPVVVISAPGGYGKTVLARTICNDNKIRATFGEIFFVHVSYEPHLKVIVEKIFHLKGHTPPEFQSDEDAIIQLEKLMRKIDPDRVLLVLDDVLPGWESHVQKLMFKIPGYKILVTTRYAFPQFEPFRLPKLNDKDAMTLFCHSAFPQAMRYDTPSFLLNKIVRCCDGIPLVLVVAGRCLFEQPEAMWVSVLERLSKQDVPIGHLQTCIDILGFLGENSIIKEHYLDLGSFPVNTSIQASALMDMWMELYKLDEMTMSSNYKPLLELLSRNLIKVDRMSMDSKLEDADGCFSEEHGLAREFGIRQSSEEPVEQLRRLILHISGNELPKWWIEQKHQVLYARLLSVTTDDTFSSNWFDMQLPEVKVMILNFSSSNYCLPFFMKRMYELKALIISNHGYHSVELKNFAQLGHLSNLRRIRLEHILIPSLGGILMQMRNLRKISLIMCKMMEATEIGTDKIYNSLPYLEEISIEYCINLLKLPAGLCNIVHLKKLSILNCHRLVELPGELGRLTNLEYLNLRGCIRLQMLPESIGDLKKLEVLDVSDCFDMMELPSRMGELHNLIKLNIQCCTGLYDLSPSFEDLVQLKQVVCSEEIYYLLKLAHPSVNIELYREPINLDWLHTL